MKRCALLLLTAVCMIGVTCVSGQAAPLFQESFESQSSVEANGGILYGGTFVPGLVGNGYLSKSAISPVWGVPIADYITFPGSGRVNMTSGTAEMYIYLDGSTLVNNSRVDLLDFLGTPAWHNRIIVALLNYDTTTGRMILNVHTTSDPFLVGFPIDTNTGGSTPVSPDTWHRVTATWSGLDGVSVPIVKCYFDGLEVASHVGAAGSILMVDTPPVFYVGTIYQGYTEPRPFVVFDELSILDQPVSPIEVTGRVLARSSGLPVVGAVVRLPRGGPGVVTGADGAYSFNLLPGEYTLSASASGFQTSEESIVVTDGVPVEQNITLDPEPIFDLAADMSTTVNPSGLWEYGFKTLPTSSALTSYDSYTKMNIAGVGAPAPDWLNGSFESPDVEGSDIVWGPTPGWYTYDRYGIGFTNPGVLEAPGLATDGTQVGVAREGWLAQHWVLADNTWPPTVEGYRYTFSVDLGIDTYWPTQGLRPRTCSLKIHGTPDMVYWADLAVLDLDLSSLTPGTMQRFSVSLDCTAANAGFTTYIALDQTEANSMIMLDNATYEIAPIVAEGIPAWVKPGESNSGFGKNTSYVAIGGASGQPWIEPGMAFAFPGGSGEYATARWISPSSGPVDIRAVFTGQHPDGTTSDVHIVHNGVPIYDGNISGFNGVSPDYDDRFGSTPSTAFSGRVAVAIGDTIDFCVGCDGGSYPTDATGVSALIIPTTTQTGVVTGRVTAAISGNPPIANAIVRLVGTERMVVTAADGTYSMIVPASDCEISVSKDGYHTQTESVTVSSGTGAVLNFALMKRIEIPSGMAQPFTSVERVDVDGDLSDWSASDFIILDQVYDVTDSDPIWLNADIPEAYYAAKWAADGEKLYVAIKVRDTSHYFTDEYTEWNVRDAVEMFIHTTGAGPFNYYESYHDAQHYIVGIKDSDPTQVWASMGYQALPEAANLQVVGRVDGQWLYYEAAITPFHYFSMDGIGLIESPLSAGQIIGFDVVVVGCDSSGTYTGMKAANTAAPKYSDYSTFAQHLLVEGYSTIGDVKNNPIGTGVACSGIVSAAFDDFFYIESPDRASGIRVSKDDHGLIAGQIVAVSGYVSMLPSGERFILAATAMVVGSGEVAALGMTNKALGGDGLPGGSGLDNIGLLIKTTGSIVDASGQPSSFKIDDGSGVPVSVLGVVPPGAEYVTVTGISSCIKDGNELLRGIIATAISEIQ